MSIYHSLGWQLHARASEVIALLGHTDPTSQTGFHSQHATGVALCAHSSLPRLVCSLYRRHAPWCGGVQPTGRGMAHGLD